MSFADSVDVKIGASGAPETLAQIVAIRDAVKSMGGQSVALKVETAGATVAAADLEAVAASARVLKEQAGTVRISVAANGAESTVAQLDQIAVAAASLRDEGSKIALTIAATGGAKTEEELTTIAATASELAGPKGKVVINLSTVGAAETEAQILAIEAAATELKGQNIAFKIDTTGRTEAVAAAKAEAQARRDATAAEREQASIAKARASEEAAVATSAEREQAAAAKMLQGDAFGSKVSTIAGMSLETAGVVAFAVALGVAGKEAMTFQQTMQNLQAVLHANPADLASLGGSIQQNSQDTVFTANQIAESDRQLAKAGQDANTIIAEQRDVLNLASAAQATTTEGATAYVTALKDFNLTGADSKMIADDLAKSVDSSVGNLNDMQDALKQVGPVAAQAGLDLKQTTVAIADLQNAGLQGDSGTALKIFLQRLEAPTAAARKAMADLGIEAYDSAGNMKSLMDIADQLQQKTRGLTEEQKNLDLTKIFGARGVRVADIFAAQGSAGMQDVINHENQIGDAATIAGTKLDTLQGQVHQLGSSLNVVAVNIGNTFVPALQRGTAGVTELVNLAAEATSKLGTNKFTTGFNADYPVSTAITDSTTGDINAQADRVKALQQALNDAQHSKSLLFGNIEKQLVPGFGLFASIVGDKDVARVAFLKQQLAEAQKISGDITKNAEATKALAETQLQQNIGTILNDQNSRGLRLGNAPNTIEQVTANAKSAKTYVDSFKDAFLSSGHTIQEWQTIEKNAFQDIDKNAKTSIDTFRAFEEQRLQTLLDNNAKAHALDLQGAPADLVNRAVFGDVMGLSASQIVKAKADLKAWQTTADAAGKSAAEQFGLVNKAFDGTVKALDGIKQNKGIDGLLSSLKSLEAEQSNLRTLGIDNKGLNDIVAMGVAFQSLADQEKAAASQFDSYMAASAHTDTYIKKIDDTKSHYASLEQYIKDKPLSARTQDDITYLDQYNQRLATLNNMEDQLKERQVADANKASSVIPNFTFEDSQYRATLAQYGGEVGVKVRLDVDVQQATEAASKADYLLQQIAEHPHTVALTLTGNVPAEEALARIVAGEDAAHAKADIVVVAKTLGITDVQTLADLIGGVNSKTVDITANVSTVYTSSGSLPSAGTTPGYEVGKPYATGGDVAGNMAIVGDTLSGDMSSAEVVDFANKRVYSHADSVRRGWLGGSAMPRYAKGTDYGDGVGGQPPGTVNANDPDNSVNVGGVYTAKNPGPATDLSKPYKDATAAAKTATTATKNLNTAGQDVVRTLVDMTTQANVLAGYLKGMAEGSVKEVTAQFDQQYALLSKIAQAALPKNATQEQKDAANNGAATQAMDVTIAMARALSDATVPSNDLAADFQKIRDTGTPIADNLIRQVSITRELNIANAKVLADQAALTALDDAHTQVVAARTQADRESERATTRQGWAQADADLAAQRAVDGRKLAIENGFRDQTRHNQDLSRQESERWTQQQHSEEDRARALQQQQTFAKEALQDKLTAAQDAAKGQTNSDRTLTQGLGVAAATGDFKAAEQLAIVKETQRVTNENLASQQDTIGKAIIAEDRLAAKQSFDLETQKIAETRAHDQRVTALADESQRDARAHEDTVARIDLASKAQQEATAANRTAQSRAAQEQKWQIEDVRLAEDATYKSEKDAATDRLKTDQDHAKALTTELDNAKTVEALWEKIYPLAGATANVLLTAFSQITGASATGSGGQSYLGGSPLTGANAIKTLAGHAAGGTITTPVALVGERGPELIRAPGYTVTPAAQTAQQLAPAGNLTINIAGGGGGVLDELGIARIRQVAREEMERYQRAMNGRTAATGGRR